jgi:hypothetical protein
MRDGDPRGPALAMAARAHGKSASAGKASARARLGPTPSDLVIVSRALADLADYLQPRHESAGRGRVILDRRVGERRREAHTIKDDRRQSDRRHPPTDPAEALMRVLGFMVIPTAPSAASRHRGVRKRTATPRRAARATRNHRARRRRA